MSEKLKITLSRNNLFSYENESGKHEVTCADIPDLLDYFGGENLEFFVTVSFDRAQGDIIYALAVGENPSYGAVIGWDLTEHKLTHLSEARFGIDFGIYEGDMYVLSHIKTLDGDDYPRLTKVPVGTIDIGNDGDDVPGPIEELELWDNTDNGELLIDETGVNVFWQDWY